MTRAIARVARSVFGPAALLLVATGAAAPQRTNSLTLVDSTEPGQRLHIQGQVVDGARRPVASARIHVFQTDATGHYTRDRPMDEAHARLSGEVWSDAGGTFDLYTIRPASYPNAIRLGDRERKIPAHIHMDVSAAGHAARKLQVVFADDPLLSDPYWQQWAKDAQHPVLSASRSGATDSAKLVITLEPMR